MSNKTNRNAKGTTSEGDISAVPAVDALTPEQMQENDKFDFSSYALALYFAEPFFARVLTRLARVRTRDIPTAGVTAANARPALYWNPDFFSSLTNKQVLGVLKHEAYHLALFHCTQRRYEPHMIWNWSTDCAINSKLGDDELPDNCFKPGKGFNKLTEAQMEKMRPVEVERYYAISDLVKSFPLGKSSEYYFSRFMENDAVKNMVKEAEILSEAIKAALSGGIDSHDGWDDISEEERAYIEGVVKESIREAVKHCDRHNSWGTVPQEMQSELRAMLSNEVDWRTLLRRFTGLSNRSESRSSWMRVNRKIPRKAPGRIHSYTSNIAIYIDQSGSVSDEDIELFVGELNSLGKRTQFTLFPFDTEVDEDNSFVWKKGKKITQFKRTRCGGTDFNAPTLHANKNKDIFDGYLILTDGYAPKPRPTRIRRGYIITTSGNLDFAHDSNDIVIKLKGEK